MNSTFSYFENDKMAKLEVGVDLGTEKVRLEMWVYCVLGREVEILNSFLYTEFELAVGHRGGQWVGGSSSLKIRRKSLCWRYWVLNPQSE